jgi:hypothetical protein
MHGDRHNATESHVRKPETTADRGYHPTSSSRPDSPLQIRFDQSQDLSLVPIYIVSRSRWVTAINYITFIIHYRTYIKIARSGRVRSSNREMDKNQIKIGKIVQSRLRFMYLMPFI